VSICLGMIVKNEAAVIERCMRSLPPYVDDFVILDTGSTDGTPDLIKKIADDLELPGAVVVSNPPGPFDFGEARTKMMRQARLQSKSEWLLQLDADWVLEVTSGVTLLGRDPVNVDFDAYPVTIQDHGLEWPLPMLTRMQHPWRYEGAVHEMLVDDGAGGLVCPTPLAGVRFIHHGDGGSRAGRHEQDVEALRGKDDPRSLFYLAQSLQSSGKWAEALDAYLVRAERTDGWDEEVYWSLYQAGRCAEQIGDPQNRALGLYLKAWESRPTRIEALMCAVAWLRVQKMWRTAYELADAGMDVVLKGSGLDDRLFVERWRWDWGMAFEWYTAMSMAGDRAAAMGGWESLLANDQVVGGYRKSIEWNLDWAKRQAA